MLLDTFAKVSAAAIVTMGTQLNPIPFQGNIVTSHEISLEDRYPVKSVSDVFKDNILLNLAYMRGAVQTNNKITWDEVTRPFHYEFKLNPNETFAYHDDILPEYKDSLVKTTQAHFNAQEGFKTDGYLYGDGICHLASLIYWVAKDAGLDANAPTNHNFMNIPEISKEFGVSIYSNPYSKGSSVRQNLYVTNNTQKSLTFHFDYNQDKLKVSVLKQI